MSSTTPKSLSIAFAIYRLHPRGGLEDNCLRIAEELRARGHKVTIFTAIDAPEAGVDVIPLPKATTHRTNHTRMQTFACDAGAAVRQVRFDRSVAFQTMPGFDFLFLADNIRNDIAAPLWRRISSRYRTFAALETQVFSPSSRTRVIGLSSQQMRPFETLYRPAAGRIRIAPPTVSRQKHHPESRTAENRASLRNALGIDAAAPVWLSLSLMPKVKGLDRTVEALGLIKDAHLLVVGVGASDKKARQIVAQAKRLKVDNRIHWLGFLSGDQLFRAMATSDVLAHPARTEVTGAVILEALINGLPVVATGLCGFAHHVAEAKAGQIISDPFDLAAYTNALRNVCDNTAILSANAIAYGNTAPVFQGVKTICDWIEHDI